MVFFAMQNQRIRLVALNAGASMRYEQRFGFRRWLFARDSGSYNAFIKQLKFYECVSRRTATAGRFAPLDVWEMFPPHVSAT